jgi:hypothetical protein
MRYLAILALAAVPGLAAAKPPALSPPATIQVTGRAEVSRAPDEAYIDIGVRTQAAKPQTAVARNAARMSTVLAALRAAAGPGARLMSIDYSVAPRYRYGTNGAPPKLEGYTATHVVQVRLDHLDRIGQVIDAATGAGANLLQDMRFTLRGKETARIQALAKAAVAARREAQALAAALNLTVVRIVSVEESRPVVVPVLRPRATGMRFAQARLPTPIETGPVEVSASVTLTVAVAARAR